MPVENLGDTLVIVRDARALVRRSRVSFTRLASIALRALVLLIAIQISGVASVAAELAAVGVGDVDGCCSDCPFEKDGQECPPSCPSCHCSHGGAALPAPVSATESIAFHHIVHEAIAPPGATVPRPPTLPSIYRPPRSLASV